MADPILPTTIRYLQKAIDSAETDGGTITTAELQALGFSQSSIKELDDKNDGTGQGTIALKTLQDEADEYYKKMATLLGKTNSDGKVSVGDAIAAGLSQSDADMLDANDGKKDNQIDSSIIKLQLNDIARSLHRSEGAVAAVSGNINDLKGMLDALKTTEDTDPSNPTHRKTTVDEAVKLLTKLGYSDADAQALAKQLDKDDNAAGNGDGSIQLNRLANAALRRSADLLGGTGDMTGRIEKAKFIDILKQNGMSPQDAEAAANLADKNNNGKLEVKDLATELSKLLLPRLQGMTS